MNWNDENSINNILDDYELEENLINNNNILNKLNEDNAYDLNISEIIKERGESNLFILDLEKRNELKHILLNKDINNDEIEREEGKSIIKNAKKIRKRSKLFGYV